MQLIYSPDKFGYYTVGDYKTYSKLDAIQLQKNTGHFPEWNFNDLAFKSIDWTQEPSIDLWDLYKSRARQIRENYDYVVLWYSGGSDSHNIVSAWLDADCKLDEVATFWNYEGSRDNNDLMNAEPQMVVFDKIKTLQEKTDFKFRLIDLTQMYLDAVNTKDMLYSMNGRFCVHGFARNLLREKIEDYQRMISEGKRLCFVWGLDKPQMFWDGRHYIQFLDFFGMFLNPYIQERYHQGWYDEMFYWSPDMPQLIVKQAQIVKRFLDTVDDPQFYQDKRTTNGYNPKIDRYLKTNTLRSLIYPRWDLTTFSNGKSNNKVYSQRDEWFWQSNLDEREKLDSQIRSYLNSIGKYWINDEHDVSKGVKCHASPRYYL